MPMNTCQNSRIIPSVAQHALRPCPKALGNDHCSQLSRRSFDLYHILPCGVSIGHLAAGRLLQHVTHGIDLYYCDVLLKSYLLI